MGEVYYAVAANLVLDNFILQGDQLNMAVFFWYLV